MSIQWNNENYLAHYGVPRRSGRYKWGSGKDPYHHGASLPSGSKKSTKKEYKEKKKENKEAYKSIKKGLNKEYTTKINRVLEGESNLDNKLNAKKQFKVLDEQIKDLADKSMADRRAAYKDYKSAKKDLKNTYKNNNKDYKQTEEYRKARNKKIMAAAAGATVAATTAYFATHPEARSKVSSMMKNAGHSDKKISELPTTNRLALPAPNSPNSPKQYTAPRRLSGAVSSQKSNSSSINKTVSTNKTTRIAGVTRNGGLYKQIPQGVSTHKGATPRRLYNDGIERAPIERAYVERIPINRVPLNPPGTVTRRRKRK